MEKNVIKLVAQRNCVFKIHVMLKQLYLRLSFKRARVIDLPGMQTMGLALSYVPKHDVYKTAGLTEQTDLVDDFLRDTRITLSD